MDSMIGRPSPRTDRPGLIALAGALHLATHQCDGNCGQPTLRGDGLETRLYDAGVRAAQEAPAPEGLPRGVLLREIDDARNAGIRPAGGDELRAWNYLLDHFEQFVKGWPFPSPAEPPRPDEEPMQRCCTFAGCKCRYAPSRRGSGHNHAKVGCRTATLPSDPDPNAVEVAPGSWLHWGLYRRGSR